MTKYIIQKLNTIYLIAGLALVLVLYYLTNRSISIFGNSEGFFGTSDDKDDKSDDKSDDKGDSKAIKVIQKSIKQGNKILVDILEKVKTQQDLKTNQAKLTSSIQSLDILNKCLSILKAGGGGLTHIFN